MNRKHPNFDEVILEKKLVEFQTSVSDYMLMEPKFETFMDDVSKHMIVRLKDYVLAEKLVDKKVDVTFEYPASWWQHFKETYRWSWWIRWFVSRWPVKMQKRIKHVDFTQYATFPGSPIRTPERYYTIAVPYETLDIYGGYHDHP